MTIHETAGCLINTGGLLTQFQVGLKLGGFDMTKENAPMTHGIHIHNYGDMRDSCESLGSHFNPDDTAHADKDAHIR
jgi:Cu/Zn superoxide dismutase